MLVRHYLKLMTENISPTSTYQENTISLNGKNTINKNLKILSIVKQHPSHILLTQCINIHLFGCTKAKLSATVLQGQTLTTAHLVAFSSRTTLTWKAIIHDSTWKPLLLILGHDNTINIFQEALELKLLH